MIKKIILTLTLATFFPTATQAGFGDYMPHDWKRDWRVYGAAGGLSVSAVSIIALLGVGHKLRKQRKKYNSLLNVIAMGTKEEKESASTQLPLLENEIARLERARQGLIAPALLGLMGAGGLGAWAHMRPRTDAKTPPPHTPNTNQTGVTPTNPQQPVTTPPQSPATTPATPPAPNNTPTPPPRTPQPRPRRDTPSTPAKNKDGLPLLINITRHLAAYKDQLPKNLMGQPPSRTQITISGTDPSRNDLAHIFYNIGFFGWVSNDKSNVLGAAQILKGQQSLSTKDKSILTDNYQHRAHWFIHQWPKATPENRISALQALAKIPNASLTLTD